MTDLDKLSDADLDALGQAFIREKMRREQARGQLGDAGLRDPDATCVFFWPENTDRLDLRIPECSGDGHYLCHKCRNYTGGVDE